MSDPRDTSKEHGDRIAAREKANAPWDKINKRTGKPKLEMRVTKTPTETMLEADRVANAAWETATGKQIIEKTQQALDIRQNISLRQVYDILYRHVNDDFTDTAKCAVFNESYEIIKRYYEEQYK